MTAVFPLASAKQTDVIAIVRYRALWCEAISLHLRYDHFRFPFAKIVHRNRQLEEGNDLG